ncbi:MAG: MlaD family protein, partial [Silvanigrellaceae bacterium]|nr:MlaD family protein [Silvanigrellaceae bacterium]
MANGFSSEFKVGVFTAIGIAVLTLTALILGGNPFLEKKQKFYTLVLDVGGVSEKTQVRTSGVQIGTVTAVSILEKGARIDFEINSGVNIPRGSTITLKGRGLLGDVYVEIDRLETAGGEVLASGSQIPLNPIKADMNSLMASLNVIAEDVKKVTKSFAQAFGTAKGEKPLKNILENIEVVTADAREIVANQKKNVQDAIVAIKKSAQLLEGLLERNDTRIDQLIKNIDRTAENFEKFSARLRELMTVENRDKLGSIIDGVDTTVKNLKEASAKIDHIVTMIENGEGTIGQLVAKNDTADEIKETLKSIQELVRPAAEMEIRIGVRGEYRFGNRYVSDSISSQANLIIAPRPDRYYLLGVTTVPYAKTITSTTT